MAVITIRGQLGCGASEIGRLVARKLQADYVDREIIAEVAARVERKEQDIIEKETPPGSLFGRIAEAISRSAPATGETSWGGYFPAYLPAWEIPLDDNRYFKALQGVIVDLARNEPIVIRGRGSQFILKDYPGSFHVMVVAPMEIRMKHVMENMKIDPENARKEIDKQDTSYREIIKRYFKEELENPVHYDLVINTGGLSYESCSAIIVNAQPLKKNKNEVEKINPDSI